MAGPEYGPFGFRPVADMPPQETACTGKQQSFHCVYQQIRLLFT
jgi:hypothetical protein